MQRPEPAEAKGTPALSPGAKSVRSPLTKDQINSRIVCSPKPIKTKISDKLSIQYSYVSQRGYYPDGTILHAVCYRVVFRMREYADVLVSLASLCSS